MLKQRKKLGWLHSGPYINIGLHLQMLLSHTATSIAGSPALLIITRDLPRGQANFQPRAGKRVKTTMQLRVSVHRILYRAKVTPLMYTSFPGAEFLYLLVCALMREIESRPTLI